MLSKIKSSAKMNYVALRSKQSSLLKIPAGKAVRRQKRRLSDLRTVHTRSVPVRGCVCGRAGT